MASSIQRSTCATARLLGEESLYDSLSGVGVMAGAQHSKVLPKPHTVPHTVPHTIHHQPEEGSDAKNDLVASFEGWEEWDASMPLWKHAVAGSCAGVAEHIGMYPLDTVKTHMQVLRPEGGRVSFGDVMRALYQEQGLGFMRGVTAIATGCIPAHIALFTSYEICKKRLLTSEEHEPLKAGVCGGVANFCHDAIITPMDLVKQRMQLGCYRGMGDCLRAVYQQEGMAALYRSMPTTLAMNIPFGAVLVAANESLKKHLGLTQRHRRSSARKELPWYFLAAGLSGAVASCATQPLDVVKTRLQTQDVLTRPSIDGYHYNGAIAGEMQGGVEVALRSQVFGAPYGGTATLFSPKYSGFTSALRTIVQEEGVLALYHGLLPRMLHAIPAAAMCWGTYESVKHMMSA